LPSYKVVVSFVCDYIIATELSRTDGQGWAIKVKYWMHWFTSTFHCWRMIWRLNLFNTMHFP